MPSHALWGAWALCHLAMRWFPGAPRPSSRPSVSTASPCVAQLARLCEVALPICVRVRRALRFVCLLRGSAAHVLGASR